VSSLKIGEATGSAIAEDAGINRSKIYDTLKKLEEMGAVSKISRDAKTMYIAKEPEEVLNDILKRFTTRLNAGKEQLNNIKGTIQYIDENVATLTTINLREFDVNKFDILISSDERTRTKFVEKLIKEYKPKDHVMLLNLNTRVPPEFIFLVSKETVLFFNNSPSNMVDNALQLIGKPITNFFIKIIQSAWEVDFPKHIIEEIDSNQLTALFTGKIMWMSHSIQGGLAPKEYTRPVSFIITDTHLVFYYEGVEDHKVPIRSISKVTIEENELI
jgi:Fe2+ or Zn2+ uptake regulation protein